MNDSASSREPSEQDAEMSEQTTAPMRPVDAPDPVTAAPKNAASEAIQEVTAERFSPSLPQEFRPRWWSRLLPGSHRRDRQMAGLQAGHQQAMQLIQSIRNNLDAQVVNQQVLIDSMRSLPAVVESLGHVGEMTERQKEMLEVIKQQLDSNMEHNSGISQSLARFSDTLNSMDSTTRHLAQRARHSEDTLQEMVRRSERRMMFMSTLLAVLLLGIGGLVGFIAWRNGWIELPKGMIPAPPHTTAQAEPSAAPTTSPEKKDIREEILATPVAEPSQGVSEGDGSPSVIPFLGPPLAGDEPRTLAADEAPAPTAAPPTREHPEGQPKDQPEDAVIDFAPAVKEPAGEEAPMPAPAPANPGETPAPPPMPEVLPEVPDIPAVSPEPAPEPAPAPDIPSEPAPGTPVVDNPPEETPAPTPTRTDDRLRDIQEQIRRAREKLATPP